MPRLVAVPAGKDEAVSLFVVGTDAIELVDSVGEDSVPDIAGGADAPIRRRVIVLIEVVGLISGTWSR